MKNGIIELDTPRGRQLGFTSDKYEGYLWKQKNSVIISFIMSKARGNFRALVQRIHALGYTVEVTTPSARMREIVVKNGYTRKVMPFSKDDPEPCEVWVLPPTSAPSSH